MADSDPTDNIVKLKPALKDRTAAERQKRYRRRKRQRSVTASVTLPVTVPGEAPVTNPVRDAERSRWNGSTCDLLASRLRSNVRNRERNSPDRGQNRIVTLATLTAALALATCSAGFSIYGLTAIFAGAFWPVVGMGAALELGKLSAVAHLGSTLSKTKGAQNVSILSHFALVALVGFLMALNSIGVYGFLSGAHIEHTVTAAARVDGKAADVRARIEVQQGVVADLDRRIGQLDSMVKAATKRGYTRTAMRLVNDQAARRTDLERQREDAAAQLARLQVEQADVTGERMAADADLGPVRYLATLVGSTDEATMRWFILAVALLLDPAAVLLLLTATRSTAR